MSTIEDLLATDPSLLLTGTPPRLIDEWQIEPSVWNQVRREVDSRGIPGQFILTGSAVPADDAARHTGAGRMSRLRIRPMTLLETGHSSGEVSLAALLANDWLATRLASVMLEADAAGLLTPIWPRACIAKRRKSELTACS